MKRLSLPWTGVVVLGAVGSILVHRWTTEPAPAPNPTQASASSQTPASADAARLQRQIDALHDELSALKRESAPAVAMRSRTQTAADRRQIQTDREQREAELAELRAAFEREPIHPAWSSKTAARVRDAANGLDALRGAVQDIQCRSRMCRVEIADDGSFQLHKQLPMWSLQLVDVLPRGEVETITDGDRPVGMVFYLMPADPAIAQAYER